MPISDFTSRELGAARWLLSTTAHPQQPGSIVCFQGEGVLKAASTKIATTASLNMPTFRSIQVESAWKAPLQQILTTLPDSDPYHAVAQLVQRTDEAFLQMSLEDRKVLTRFIVFVAFYWGNAASAETLETVLLPQWDGTAPEVVPFAIGTPPAHVTTPGAPINPVVYPITAQLRAPGVDVNGSFPVPVTTPTANSTSVMKASRSNSTLWGGITAMAVALASAAPFFKKSGGSRAE